MSADPAGAVADAHRREWAYVLAATVRVTRDLDLAEECVQEAYAQALVTWGDGVPARPGAWLTTAARRRALDLHRRGGRGPAGAAAAGGRRGAPETPRGARPTTCSR